MLWVLTTLLYLILFSIFSGCKKTEKYSDNYFIEEKQVVYAISSFDDDGKMILKKILQKDSLSEFIANINNAEYVGICEGGEITATFAIIAKDTGTIRLEILDDKIRIPIHNKCYKLNDRIYTSH